jgi:hypothetical protein
MVNRCMTGGGKERVMHRKESNQCMTVGKGLSHV